MRPLPSVAIIGAAGEMGGMLAARAEAAGCAVCRLDQPLQPEAVAGMALVVLCVPITAVETVVDALLPHLDGHSILADVCSVKTSPLTAMLRYPGPVVGTHPLFGARLPPPPDRRVAITPGRDDAAAQAVADWMVRLGFVPFRTTARSHDRAMARIHSVNFATTLATLAATARTPEVREFLTPSFRRRLDAAEKMLTVDAAMFTTILQENPHSTEAIAEVLEALQAVSSGEIEGALADALSWWP